MEEIINEKYVHHLVSSNLKRIRNMQNLSQLGLAINANLTHNFINDIENCKKGISAKTLAKLSSALKVEPYQFFLPKGMLSDTATLYVNDFNDSLQKVVKELTARYLPKNKELN